MIFNNRFAWGLACLCVTFTILNTLKASENRNQPASTEEPITLVVMDPLAAPLACDCVQGYAQRKYEKLGKFLSKKLGRVVNVHWAESLDAALRESDGQADLIIGKHSVVLSDAKRAKISVAPIAQLTDGLGETTQTGLIVVRTNDPAKSVADLKGYRIFFGPADCEEKSAAPMKLLKDHHIEIPSDKETCAACSSAATKLVELDSKVSAAAVISSYAKPLLEGCGNVKKGDLRVIGVSEPVPFVTAFVNENLSKPDQQKILAALLEVESDSKLLKAMESLDGFIEYEAIEKQKKN